MRRRWQRRRCCVCPERTFYSFSYIFFPLLWLQERQSSHGESTIRSSFLLGECLSWMRHSRSNQTRNNAHAHRLGLLFPCRRIFFVVFRRGSFWCFSASPFFLLLPLLIDFWWSRGDSHKCVCRRRRRGRVLPANERRLSAAMSRTQVYWFADVFLVFLWVTCCRKQLISRSQNLIELSINFSAGVWS